MKKVYDTPYGIVTNQYLQRDDELYTVEYEGDTYTYTANAVALLDARLLLYGVGQWYRTNALLSTHYSINAMRLEEAAYQERGREQ